MKPEGTIYDDFNSPAPLFSSRTPLLTEKCGCGAYTQAYEHADLKKWRDEHTCPNRKVDTESAS